MDRKEAADLLDNLIGMVEDSHGADYDTALRMGIEALTAGGNTIYRQAAVDAALDSLPDDEYWNEQVKKAISALPSAQPDVPDTNVGDVVSKQAVIDAIATWTVEDRPDVEMPTDLIDRIRNLTSAQPERMLYANMSDAEFERWLYEHGICNPNIHESIPCDAVPLLIDNAISELPSAQPERKTGKWLPDCEYDGEDEWYFYTCSCCDYQSDDQFKYCPSCGADMREQP